MRARNYRKKGDIGIPIPTLAQHPTRTCRLAICGPPDRLPDRGGGHRGARPDHHYSWIVVAVAILSQRAIERWPIKVTQRAIGVGIGVILSELLFARLLPEWLAVTCFVAIAGAMPWLWGRSYLLYSAAMTPLIMLVMSGGHPVTGEVPADRLVATLIGAGLVIAAGWAAAAVIRPSPSPESQPLD